MLVGIANALRQLDACPKAAVWVEAQSDADTTWRSARVDWREWILRNVPALALYREAYVDAVTPHLDAIPAATVVAALVSPGVSKEQP